jgi:hypothetical protein
VFWAVSLVPGKRKADVLEMNSNLVSPTGVKGGFDVSCAVELLQDTITGPGIAAGILGHGHAFAMAGVARDGGADFTSLMRQVAAHNRVIMFFEGALGELL